MTKQQRIAAEINALRTKTGRVRPQDVVERARDKRSILHGEFDWDVGRAAMKHWLMTAKELIRSVRLKIVYEHKTFVAPFYISDPSVRQSVFIATEIARKNKGMVNEIMQDELRRIIAAIHRAMTLSCAFDVKQKFQQMLDMALDLERQTFT